MYLTQGFETVSPIGKKIKLLKHFVGHPPNFRFISYDGFLSVPAHNSLKIVHMFSSRDEHEGLVTGYYLFRPQLKYL